MNCSITHRPVVVRRVAVVAVGETSLLKFTFMRYVQAPSFRFKYVTVGRWACHFCDESSERFTTYDLLLQLDLIRGFVGRVVDIIGYVFCSMKKSNGSRLSNTVRLVGPRLYGTIANVAVHLLWIPLAIVFDEKLWFVTLAIGLFVVLVDVKKNLHWKVR